MLCVLWVLALTAASTTVGGTNFRVSDGAPEMLRAMIGVQHLPKRSARNRIVPEAMLSMYAARNEEKSEAKSRFKSNLRGVNTIRSFTHKDRDDIPLLEPHQTETHTLLWFNVTDVPSSEKLRASEIELQRQPFLDGGVHQVYIHVHDIIRQSPLLTRLIDTRILSSSGSSKVALDVQPAVQRWLDRSGSNHGLLVELSSPNTTAAASHVRLRRSTDTDPTWLRHQPVLITYMDDIHDRSGRTRRRAQANQRKKNHKRNCRRHRMYVDFAAVGWDDWIVAPAGYEAYYCRGDCTFPLADHLNATNHAIVQTLQNSADPRVVPKPCCIPTELGPISMLYTDSDDKTVLKVYQDMVVIGCGCR